MRIALIGYGEVGRTYATAAARHGHEVVIVHPAPSPHTTEAARAAGLPIWDRITTERLSRHPVDRIWVCVTGDLALSVCEPLAPIVEHHTVLVDLTTAAASDKRAAARVFAEHGRRYVDVVIMGAVAVTKEHTPLLGAGAGANEALAEFRELGAPVSVLPESRAGDAATIKLLRTVLTKGLESLAVEALTAAEREGVRPQLEQALGDVDESGFGNFLNMLVRTHVQHAGRRLHEVRRAQDQLGRMGSPSLVLPGSEQRFAATVAALSRQPLDHEGTIDTNAALLWLTGIPDRTR